MRCSLGCAIWQAECSSPLGAPTPCPSPLSFSLSFSLMILGLSLLFGIKSKIITGGAGNRAGNRRAPGHGQEFYRARETDN
jgi:hypothetical protein